MSLIYEIKSIVYLPINIQIFKKHGAAANNASLFVTLIKPRQVKIISDEHVNMKLPRLKVFKLIILNIKIFLVNNFLKDDSIN